jgi:hypothetical protein
LRRVRLSRRPSISYLSLPYLFPVSPLPIPNLPLRIRFSDVVPDFFSAPSVFSFGTLSAEGDVPPPAV